MLYQSKKAPLIHLMTMISWCFSISGMRVKNEKISEHPEETSKEYLAHQSKEKLETWTWQRPWVFEYCTPGQTQWLQTSDQNRGFMYVSLHGSWCSRTSLFSYTSKCHVNLQCLEPVIFWIVLLHQEPCKDTYIHPLFWSDVCALVVLSQWQICLVIYHHYITGAWS